MKKFKKLISFCLVVTILVSSVFLSSSSQVDPILETATEITRKLFNSYEGEDLAIYDYIPSSYVKGVDGEEDYIISERGMGGYAIFEKDTMELIEYSPTEESPYKDVQKQERHYAGPVNYFQGKDNQFRSLTSNEVFSSVEIKPLAMQLKQKLQIDREERLTAKEEIELPIIREEHELNSTITENEEHLSVEPINDLEIGVLADVEDEANSTNTSSEVIDPGPTGHTNLDASSYNVVSATYIPKYQFFVGHDEHGENDRGICSSIAAQILLSYLNWEQDGRIIPEQFLSQDRDESKPYSDEMRFTSSTHDFDGNTSLSFLDILVNLINNNSSGASLSKIRLGVINYLEQYAPEIAPSINQHFSATINNTLDETYYSSVTQIIDSGEPILMARKTFTPNETDGWTLGFHAVVVYGYQTIFYNGQSLKGFIAHDGEPIGGRTHIWFNKDWSNGYLHFNFNHQHRDVPLNDDDNHIVKCTVCDRINTQGVHRFNDCGEDVGEYHIRECFCGYKLKERHKYDEYVPVPNEAGGNVSSYHSAKCSTCEHLEGVLAQNGISAHFYKAGSNLCYFCGYDANTQ